MIHTTIYIYGRTECRGDCDTITEEFPTVQLLTMMKASLGKTEDEVNAFADDLTQADVPESVITLAFGSSCNGERGDHKLTEERINSVANDSIGSGVEEDSSFGYGPTLRDAKISFIDVDGDC